MQIIHSRIARQARLFFTVALALLLAGCAGAPQRPETSNEEKALVWPAAPSQAVIEYVSEFNSERVFENQSKSSWKDSLLGEDEQSNRSLITPYGVSVHQDGRIMVTDTKLAGLATWDFDKEIFAMIGTDGPGMIFQPIGVSSDRFGRIYVSLGADAKVNVYDVNGKFLNVLGGDGEFGRPVGIAVDNERERIFVSDMLRHHVAVFDFEGKRTGTVGERGEDLLQFNYPLALDIDATGRLYVLDSMNFRLQVIEPDLETARSIGEQGGGLGQFNRPKGLAVDSDLNIYVVDSAFNNVQMFNNQGQVLMYFGEMGINPGQFSLPAGIAIHGDMIYVADQSNGRIQVFRYLGAPEIIDEDAAKAE
jgi:DNA-binding beta-propeller fold protein YncE